MVRLRSWMQLRDNEQGFQSMKSEKLQKYQDVFSFMLEHNCKAEQETIKAAE